jgi:hypothetical protein
MKQFLGLTLTIIIACSVGCAGTGSNTVAGNVATGATINALAGVPGAGIVGLTAMAVDVITTSGRPQVGKLSPALLQQWQQAPLLFIGPDKSTWKPRKLEDGRLITEENAPKRSMEYKEAVQRAISKYVDGQFGDTPEMQQKNLKAWEERKTVVAEYSGPNNANIVFVSTDREPAEVMFSEEWAARNAAGAAEKPGVLKEPASVLADKPVDTKGSASNFIDKAGDLNEPNAKN